MKKIFSITGLVGTLFVSGTLFAFAYTPYYNTYQNAPRSNSYVYTSGCYIYQYDAYTHITSLIGSNCTTSSYQNSYQNSYYNNYSYSYPVNTAYTVPTSYSQSYSYPVNTAYVSPSSYYTYGYTNGSWYPGYQNSILGNLFDGSYNNSYYNNSYSNYNMNYNNNGCYYQNGYQVCY